MAQHNPQLLNTTRPLIALYFDICAAGATAGASTTAAAAAVTAAAAADAAGAKEAETAPADGHSLVSSASKELLARLVRSLSTPMMDG